jgi:hypothetical protein
MPSISTLRSGAHNIAETSQHPDVAKLAGIIEQLCGICAELEQKTKEAYEEAKRAKREARK